MKDDVITGDKRMRRRWWGGREWQMAVTRLVIPKFLGLIPLGPAVPTRVWIKATAEEMAYH